MLKIVHSLVSKLGLSKVIPDIRIDLPSVAVWWVDETPHCASQIVLARFQILHVKMTHR